ncbi:hypothetical protein R5N98_06535 [Tenacibaculum maritimum]|uniref:hypothetical protein n=1 Tax=Tenacibaculum maritimum TaxID=107401 RepID=UPI0010A561CF|nr:hypothetical protein [Tenacibaculum maritimum]QCD61283.1 hypothetical protein B9C57_01415 [Tenacibaculum maritimum]CAA0154666.1 Probable lipoprotein precursor [Tenacibaculum maritimum]CAA0156944.1 Probable lipoprotein precursor [Tenacibaculum maritimum]CAA0157589.1 Probable lipoprotein precursor [Tenacibaculum maritimum]CAA0168068.1 Probable lipoprotein precursor [Tenacibaculum maritimum]
MKKIIIKLAFIALSTISFISCSSEDAAPTTPPLPTAEKLEKFSPWITTAIYKVSNGQIDTSINYISDSIISRGTISSAQYKNGKFIFVPVNYITGKFADTISDNLTANYGKFEIFKKSNEEYRRLFDTNFNYTNERKVIKINNEEFTYELKHSSGNTYYVEHFPYNKKFPSLIYPNELQAAIDKRFSEIK